MIPNVATPHKPDAQPHALRQYLAELAFAGMQGVVVVDATRDPAFIRDAGTGLVTAVRARHPGAIIFNALGEDSFASRLESPDVMRAENIRYVAYSRGGRALSRERLAQMAAASRNPAQAAQLISDLMSRGALLTQEVPGNSGVSSTRQRETLARGEIPTDLHPDVVDVVMSLNLYGARRPAGWVPRNPCVLFSAITH